MKYTDHIDVSNHAGRCCLSVHDAELFDFLDDFFFERDLNFDIVQIQANGKPLYRMLFLASISQAAVFRHLSTIASDEIERIYRLNNPTVRSRGN